MPELSYRTKSIDVPGGVLHAAMWGETGPVILCSHGITANHMSFLGLAEALADRYRLLAVDHRGRGQSRDISGPWGMQHHAGDLMAAMEAFDVKRADWMIGHSMGGFVSVVTKALNPDRVGRVILADGGLPLMAELPANMTIEQIIEAIIGPAMARLDRTFASREAYLAFWKEHPALAPYWNKTLEEYLSYDLCGAAPNLQPTARKAAIIGDTESQLASNIVIDSLNQIDEEIVFLRATRGMFDADPLYSEVWTAQLLKAHPQIRHIDADDVNHYTIVASDQGAAQIAQIMQAG